MLKWRWVCTLTQRRVLSLSTAPMAPSNPSSPFTSHRSLAHCPSPRRYPNSNRLTIFCRNSRSVSQPHPHCHQRHPLRQRAADNPSRLLSRHQIQRLHISVQQARRVIPQILKPTGPFPRRSPTSTILTTPSCLRSCRLKAGVVTTRSWSQTYRWLLLLFKVQQYLCARGIGHVILCGLTNSGVIHGSVRLAVDMDFHAIVPWGYDGRWGRRAWLSPRTGYCPGCGCGQHGGLVQMSLL